MVAKDKFPRHERNGSGQPSAGGVQNRRKRPVITLWDHQAGLGRDPVGQRGAHCRAVAETGGLDAEAIAELLCVVGEAQASIGGLLRDSVGAQGSPLTIAELSCWCMGSDDFSRAEWHAEEGVHRQRSD